LHAAQPALLQALQEAPPVDFMLAQGHGNAQDFAFACRSDTHCHQDG
jgi:hypothetical protein